MGWAHGGKEHLTVLTCVVAVVKRILKEVSQVGVQFQVADENMKFDTYVVPSLGENAPLQIH